MEPSTSLLSFWCPGAMGWRRIGGRLNTLSAENGWDSECEYRHQAQLSGRKTPIVLFVYQGF